MKGTFKQLLLYIPLEKKKQNKKVDTRYKYSYETDLPFRMSVEIFSKIYKRYFIFSIAVMFFFIFKLISNLVKSRT